MLKRENFKAPVKESKRDIKTSKFRAWCASSSYDVTLLITECSIATKGKKTNKKLFKYHG